MAHHTVEVFEFTIPRAKNRGTIEIPNYEENSAIGMQIISVTFLESSVPARFTVTRNGATLTFFGVKNGAKGKPASVRVEWKHRALVQTI